MLAARGSAAAADVAEWTQVAHASLNIMTESFATRTLGVVTGVASGGPDAGFGCDSLQPCTLSRRVLTGSCPRTRHACPHPPLPPPARSESGVSLVLERSAALLRALPDLLAAVGAPLTEPLPAPLADAPETAAAATAWRLRQVGCMLVQLISRACESWVQLAGCSQAAHWAGGRGVRQRRRAGPLPTAAAPHGSPSARLHVQC